MSLGANLLSIFVPSYFLTVTMFFLSQTFDDKYNAWLWQFIALP